MGLGTVRDSVLELRSAFEAGTFRGQEVHRRSGSGMQIFIKTLTGRKQNYTFKPEDKVSLVASGAGT